MKKFFDNEKNLIYIVIALTIIHSLLALDINGDIFFMIKHGEYLVNNNFSFPTTEFLTMHEGLNFQMEKWLSCLVFYLLYSKFGMISIDILGLLSRLCWLFVYIKYVKLITKRETLGHADYVPYLLLEICFYTKRPHMFSIMIFLCELYFLEKYVQTGKKNNLYIIPLLSVLLMQFHSTLMPIFFILGLPFAFDNATVEFKEEGVKVNGYKNGLDRDKTLAVVITGVISFLVTAINPYGINSVIYMVKSMAGTGAINELATELSKPLLFDGVTALMLFGMIIFISKICREHQKVLLRSMILIFSGFVLYAYAYRNIEFLILGSISILPHIQKQYMKEERWDKFAFILTVVLIFGMIFAVRVGFIENFKQPRIILGDTDKEAYQQVYKKVIEDAGIEKEDKIMVTNFEAGTYLEFMGYKPYADARLEVFEKNNNGKEDILMEYLRFIMGQISIQEMQEKYNFDYWVCDISAFPYEQMLHEEEYKLVAENAKMRVFKYIGK